MSFRNSNVTCSLLAMCLAAGAAVSAHAQPTAFTYQGELNDNGQLAEGVYDLQFSLYDAAGGGTQIGSTICLNDVEVHAGMFSAALDFGRITLPAAYLEISVRADLSGERDCGDAQDFSIVPLRQLVGASAWASSADAAGHATSADHATQAAVLNGLAQPLGSVGNLVGVIPSSLISGAYSNKLTLSSSGNTFYGDGSAIKNATASLADLADNANLFAGAAQADLQAISRFDSGTLPDKCLSGTYSQAILFNRPGNTFAGDGSHLTQLKGSGFTTYANFPNATVGSSAGNTTYATFINLTNSANTFNAASIIGSGAGLTGLNVTQFANSTTKVAAAAIPQIPLADIAGPETLVGSFYKFGMNRTVTDNQNEEIYEAGTQINVPFDGYAVFTWTASCWTGSNLAYPHFEVVIDDKYSPGSDYEPSFDVAGVHQSFQNSCIVHLTPGWHWISIGVSSGTGVPIYFDSNDSVMWTVMMATSPKPQ